MNKTSPKQYRLLNQHSDIVIPNLKLANTFITRFKGLMGSNVLSKDEGLLITPCQQVHTHFMAYPLDLVFIDQEDKVIEILTNIKPWRFSKYIKKSKAILELSANTANEKIQLGDTLVYDLKCELS